MSDFTNPYQSPTPIEPAESLEEIPKLTFDRSVALFLWVSASIAKVYFVAGVLFGLIDLGFGPQSDFQLVFEILWSTSLFGLAMGIWTSLIVVGFRVVRKRVSVPIICFSGLVPTAVLLLGLSFLGPIRFPAIAFVVYLVSVVYWRRGAKLGPSRSGLL